ncbi:unnamed protein product [Brassica rapa]|uniref:Replication factor A C-terminal domain-containing protein n=1 Tax=Brassica campestris TaxID=3711 RepID=A0A8D9HJ99_BRACM|nr:unnamed protein product [Brassica rapa]
MDGTMSLAITAGKKLDNSAASLSCNQCLHANASGVVSHITIYSRYHVELLVDDGNNYATFLVVNKEMLKLTKQDAAALLQDEVNRGVSNILSQGLTELAGQAFVFLVHVTPYNFTPNTHTFTVYGISDNTNTEALNINESTSVQVRYGEAASLVSSNYTSTDEVEEGGRTHTRE